MGKPIFATAGPITTSAVKTDLELLSFPILTWLVTAWADMVGGENASLTCWEFANSMFSLRAGMVAIQDMSVKSLTRRGGQITPVKARKTDWFALSLANGWGRL